VERAVRLQANREAIMHWLTIPWRALANRPLRSGLTVLGIAIAVASFVAMTGLTAGVLDALEKGFDEPGADLIVSQRGLFALSGGAIPQSLEAKLRSVPFVEDASGVLFNIMTADGEANVIAAGWPPSSFLWGSAVLKQGRLPAGGESLVAVLGEAIAEILKKSVGDEIALHNQKFRVIGVAHFGSPLNRSMVLVPLSSLQELLSREGLVTFFQVRLRRPIGPDALTGARTQIAAVAPGYAVQDARELTHDLRLNRLLTAIAATVSYVILVLAMLGVANTLLMAISERTEEIGVLSAVGWSAQRIVGMILIEGMMMSLVGLIVGVGIGIGFMHIASLSGFASGLLQPFLNVRIVLEVSLAAIAIGGAASCYPAWRAVRMSPAHALRRI
jgi:putative ABC transport system permease protein